MCHHQGVVSPYISPYELSKLQVRYIPYTIKYPTYRKILWKQRNAYSQAAWKPSRNRGKLHETPMIPALLNLLNSLVSCRWKNWMKFMGRIYNIRILGAFRHDGVPQVIHFRLGFSRSQKPSILGYEYHHFQETSMVLPFSGPPSDIFRRSLKNPMSAKLRSRWLLPRRPLTVLPLLVPHLVCSPIPAELQTQIRSSNT